MPESIPDNFSHSLWSLAFNWSIRFSGSGGGGGGAVTVIPSASKAQLVAPFGAIKPSPDIIAEPTTLPFTALPATDATVVLLEAKLPPVHPAGTVMLAVCPVWIMPGGRV